MSELVEPQSSAFSQLDERIQRWIWSEGWTAMRDVQEMAVPALIDADRDVIIAAATASGKTEAAFFPILTNLLRHNTDESGCAVYISPLKALINDQWGRLEKLCEDLEIPVTPWHGDISQSRKTGFLKKPCGILLITPESFEAMFVNRGSSLSFVFKKLRYVVIDELHAFIGNERGKQLQSLLHRLDVITERSVPRVGLSATLGDMNLAASFLRPRKSENVSLLVSKSAAQEIRLLIKGYVEKIPKVESSSNEANSKNHTVQNGTSIPAIAEHLYRSLRGTNNLIFPNSRRLVEIYADLLRRRCENENAPNEFWPHHGSLSKDIREETETALKSGDRPATAICTSTLELGIDIGAVKSVAQIGVPPSVASLRQRLGRSGRRIGEPAILRCYCVEREITEKSSLSDRLHEGLVQSIAMVQLLLSGWCEPPRPQGIHASTLVQQLLSLIAQYGGITVPQAWKILVKNGVFANVSQDDFVVLLKNLSEHDLIHQDDTDLLLLGERGEKLVNHYDFYAAFVSEEEFRLIHNGSALGSVPISHPLLPEQHIIFAGRRWQVVDVDSNSKTIVVIPSPGGLPPQFDGGGGMVHDRVRQKMRDVLAGSDAPAFLDPAAKTLLAEARDAYKSASLANKIALKDGKSLLLMYWKGDWVNNALSMFLTALGHTATNEGMFIRVSADDMPSIIEPLKEISATESKKLLKTLECAKNIQREKWDWSLPNDLLIKSFSASWLDIQGAQQTAQEILKWSV